MLDARESILRLVELTQSAKSMQIFIGAENQLFNLSGCTMIVAPYTAGAEGGRGATVLGAIGVIGPTRMNYARIIPLVDYTARVVGQALGHTGYRDETMTQTNGTDHGDELPETMDGELESMAAAGADGRGVPGAQGPAAAHAGRDGESARPHPARDRGCAQVRGDRLRARPDSRSATISPAPWRRSPPKRASRASS